jgi:hypothetical protein
MAERLPVQIIFFTENNGERFRGTRSSDWTHKHKIRSRFLPDYHFADILFAPRLTAIVRQKRDRERSRLSRALS